MKNLIKRFFTLLILFLTVYLFSVTTFAQANIPSATSDFYVNDFANIFSEDEKARLIDAAATLADESNGIQLVITTITSLDNCELNEYALQMYNQYGIGKDDMGLLILLSTGDRQIRIQTGKALEAYINDAKAGRFIDKYAIPFLKENNFAKGLISLQKALVMELTPNVVNNSKAQVSVSSQNNSSKNNSNLYANLGMVLIVGIIIVCIILLAKLVRKIIALSRKKQETINNLIQQLEDSKKETARVKIQADEKVSELQENLDSLASEKKHFETLYGTLDRKYETLTDRYQRVQQLYPSADKDVTNMINEEIRQRDMACAKQVDEEIQELIFLQPSKDIVPKLSHARDCYFSLSKKQRTYVKSDMNKFNQLYDKSVILKQQYEKKMEEQRQKNSAMVAGELILAIISRISIGKAKDLSKLKEAKAIYTKLDSGSQSYFDQSILDKLDKLYREAKHDEEEKEAEERRRREEESRRRKQQEEMERRRRMQNNSSSFGSSSHHSGFGGSSGGGGASRGF